MLLCNVVVVAWRVVDVGSDVVDMAVGATPDESPPGTVVDVVVVEVVVVVVSGVTATEAPDVALVFTAFSALTRN